MVSPVNVSVSLAESPGLEHRRSARGRRAARDALLVQLLPRGGRGLDGSLQGAHRITDIEKRKKTKKKKKKETTNLSTIRTWRTHKEADADFV